MVPPDAAELGRGAESGERAAGPGCGAAPARGPRSKWHRLAWARVSPGVGTGPGRLSAGSSPLSLLLYSRCGERVGGRVPQAACLFCFSKVLLLSGLPGPACAAVCVCMSVGISTSGHRECLWKTLKKCVFVALKSDSLLSQVDKHSRCPPNRTFLAVACPGSSLRLPWGFNS